MKDVTCFTCTGRCLGHEPKRLRFWIGHKRNVSGNNMEVFKAINPTSESHGSVYFGVTGPFKTKRAAVFMATKGWMNPHCLSVAQAKKLAREVTL